MTVPTEKKCTDEVKIVLKNIEYLENLLKCWIVMTNFCNTLH